jgi:hypothetical protein
MKPGVQRPDGLIVWFEKKFHLEEIHPLLYGTADCVIYDPKKKILRVIDYKHGKGKLVEVLRNVQLMYYALGAFYTLELPVQLVEITIVQPRAFHPDGPIRSYTFDVVELLEFREDLLEAARRTELEDAPLVPGEHCRWCPAKALCPALVKQANEIAKEEFREGLPYDPQRLGEILQVLPALEAYVSGVKEFAYAEAMRGREIPGWKLVEKRATRKWVGESQAKEALREILGPKEMEACYEISLKSAPQIERLLGKKKFKELEPVVVSVSSGMALVPDRDPRPTAACVAADVFDDVTVIPSLELLG